MDLQSNVHAEECNVFSKVEVKAKRDTESHIAEIVKVNDDIRGDITTEQLNTERHTYSVPPHRSPSL